MKKTSFKTVATLTGLVLALTLTGCATGLKGTPNEVTVETVRPRVGYGVVFGRICGGNGLWFQSKNSPGTKYLHIGGKTAFALQLPYGTYQLVRVGSPIGVMVTDKPLEFSVQDGTANYVGTLLPRWTNSGDDRLLRTCSSEESKLVKSMMWSNDGTFGVGKPIWALDLADDIQPAIRDVQKSFPKLDVSNSQSSLMH